MARVEHRRILLRLYADVPSHQKILQWLDGYSGRGLQTILCEALAIGLPQYLGEATPVAVAEVPTKPKPIPSEPKSPVPVRSESMPVRSESIPVRSEPIPAFVESQQQGSAREALKQLFEKEMKI